MQLGFVGLGKMGLNMVARLRRSGHEIVAFDRNAEAVEHAAATGARSAISLDALVSALSPPRAIWIMVPAGEPTESTVTALGKRLSANDVIVDGGNSKFHDDVRRAETLAAKDGDLASLKGFVEDSGEGRWTLHEAVELGVPLPVITAALFTRFRSRETDPFGERLLAALRQRFGGRAVQPAGLSPADRA